ncbi:ABC transporter ATP-binding protein [Curtobacterium sp. MCLR17_036]|uniref:ABC transporter ATP-binding protein n=1 Tax=Curtobacterium sp. MCLR17_036 TaxID=2175620 RepID=UPI0024E00E41|nr:ABC transporter ATP-binding protein [Curtobacterium sp. MCLR17_036]WIE64453.1 ABC transporter ATP-binding protein [Curtobacterium sp. MCLR17_036]
MSTTPFLVASGVGHDHRSPAGPVRALDGVDLVADRGELVVVHGTSGSGKSTLLQVLGGLVRPSRGSVLVDGVHLARSSEAELLALRRDRVAFVFQDFRLLPELTAAENIEVPLRIARTDPAERDDRVRAVLADVGLADHAAQRPDQLSGGQQQRVGVARAVVGRPGLLLADEPTAQLDSVTSAGIVDLIARLVERDGLTAVVTSSDDAFAERATRIVELPDR